MLTDDSSKFSLNTEEAAAGLFSRIERRLSIWSSRLSLRTRLILAFFVLIITSASATVLIGEIVFGSKVISLATSKMEVGLRLTELAIQSQIDKLQILSVYQKERALERKSDAELCSFPITSEIPIDYALLLNNDELFLVRLRLKPPFAEELVNRISNSVKPVSNRCEVIKMNPDRIIGSRIAEFLRLVAAGVGISSGFIAIDERSMSFLVGQETRVKGLLLVAAASIRNQGAYMIVTLVNGRDDLLAKAINLVFPNRIESHMATLFLGDRRIATLLGKEALGTRVDGRVAKAVLLKGSRYLGASNVGNIPSFAAYMPLKDFRGVTVGILGIATPESHYLEMKQQTVSLFAALIALGMIFGFVMTYMFSGFLIRPVAELAKGMQRVAEGDMDYKIRVASTDELGKLSKAFNRMVTNIKERDMRLREMTNEQLSQVDKQVSIGRLAAGVAHEINNPLTSVLSLSMLMLKRINEDDSRKEDLQLIVEETNRCRTIVRSLLDFAREGPSEKRPIDVNQAIKDTLVLVKRYESMEGIEVALKLAKEPLIIEGDLEQLRQVFANVLINAAEAHEKNEGRIVVTTDEDSSGGFVIARIKDRGVGISKENLTKVFQPFFTTKGASKGTGLGLSVSQGIVRKHGGTIEIESEEGKGTTVTILLPRLTG